MKKINLLLLLLLGVMAVPHVRAQNIYTVAGNGSNTYSGDGGPATSAGISAGPESIVADNNCNIYFVDGDCIRKIDAATGNISLFAGNSGAFGYSGDGGPATSARFTNPAGLAVDASNNIYVADCDNQVIRKINTSGIISTVAGNNALGAGHSGDGSAATSAQLCFPLCVYIDQWGNMYIGGDRDNFYMRKVNTSGIISTIAGNGSSGYTGDGGPATSASTGSVTSIVVDPHDYVIFADPGNNAIRYIDQSDGTMHTMCGTGTGSSGFTADGHDGHLAALNTPNGLFWNNGLCFCDAGNSRVRMLSPGLPADYAGANTLSTIAGNGIAGFSGDLGPATSAEVHAAYMATADKMLNTFISDYSNNRIRMVATPNYLYVRSSPVITGTTGSAVSITMCSPVANTYTATSASGAMCGAYTITWYKKIGGVVTTVGTGDNYTDTNPTDGEQIYCTYNYPGDGIRSVSAYNITSGTITVHVDQMTINADINTICAPGSAGATAPVPQYSVTMVGTGGLAPYHYAWAALSDNNMTISGTTIANPQVTGIINHSAPLVSDYSLTVTDARGCVLNQNVKTKFITSGFDLASRDSYVDMYDEPNTQEAVTGNWQVWTSPDIWNRHFNDGLTVQVNESPQRDPSADDNFLYVKIRNVGCISSPAATENMYWTKGGTSEQWSFTPSMNDWNGATVWNAGGTAMIPEGQLISAQPIPSLAAGASTILQAAWVPPLPSDYDAGATSMELCFLSRIVDGHQPAHTDGMTTQEGPGLSDNVRGNNNIVTLNTSVAFVFTLTAIIHHINIGNASSAAAFYSLQFANSYSLIHNSSTSVLNQFTTTTVSLGSVFALWMAGGAKGTYKGIDREQKTVTFDGTNTMQLDNIKLPPNSEYPVSFAIKMLPGADGTQMPVESINFRQLTYTDSPKVYGNYTYIVQYQADSPESRHATAVSTVATTKQTVTVHPNPAINVVYFNFPVVPVVTIRIYDINGRIMEERTVHNEGAAAFDVQKYAAGTYTYQVIAGNDVQSGKIVVSNK